jgi:mono/diheme cytochrome c family protein
MTLRLPWSFTCWFVVLIALVQSMQAADEPKPKEPSASAERLFADRVLPVLREKCFSCHGEGDLEEGGLDLTSRAEMLLGGESKLPTLVPGKPHQSRLYQAVLRQDAKLKMPPEDADQLSETEVTAIRDWIAGGAPWVDVANDLAKPVPAEKDSSAPWNAADSKEGIEVATSGGQSDSWTHRKYQVADVWAYQPLRRHPVPRHGLEPADAAHPIDAFVRSALAAKEIKPAAAAEKATWLRRASFDLTGLPPTPRELQIFMEDSSAGAKGAAVERLLASPHYGEQMARLWLDVVRYSDTSGFSNDYERPHAWRYRDYVVRSFNQDKPFDRFVVEQLAGDELDPSDPEMLIAAGYLRMGPWEHTAMSVAVETRQQFLDDVTHSVGVTFLGQGLRCAKCHDHKFDPLPTRDYYRLQAVFAPVQFHDRPVAFLPVEDVSSLARSRPRSARLLQEADDFLAGLKQKHEAAQAVWLKEHNFKDISEVAGDKRPPRHLGLSKLEMSLEKVYQKRVDYYKLEMRRYEPQALSVFDGPPVVFDMQRGAPARSGKRDDVRGQTRPRASAIQVVHVLKGGALESPGETVTPGVLSAAFASSDRQQPTAWNTIPNTAEGRRLALAQWIAAANNPLTARVIVNRVWQQHFGKGLVATPNNFGKMGARPTHPELLDWLAVWFIDRGWSIKQLQRLIMTSQTYGQSSDHPQFDRLAEVDARNDLLACFPVRRLAAEEVRDATLAASGELNVQVGGPPVYPEINWEVALQPRHIMGSVAPAYQPSLRRVDRHRRTLYAFHCRTLGDPLLEVFNKPGSDISCERRDQTIVAPQALALFNGQSTHDRALALALRLEKLASDPGERLDQAFLLAYSRRPTDRERQECLAHVARMTEYHRTHAPRKMELPRKVRREMIEELTGETFGWDEDLDQMAEFEPDAKPWDVGPETRAWAELALVLFNSNEFLCVR